jgi:hypothetical protein
MKKVIAISFVFMLIPFLGFAQDKDEFTVRGSSWGDSKSEVVEEEGEPDKRLTDDPEAFLYTDRKISGISTIVQFEFNEGSLYAVSYRMTESYRNKANHRRDFNSLENLLGEKYGSPDKRIQKRDDNEYTDFETELVLGDVYYSTVWEEGDTEISHTMYVENKTLNHRIIYAYQPTMNRLIEKDEKEAKDKL